VRKIEAVTATKSKAASCVLRTLRWPMDRADRVGEGTMLEFGEETWEMVVEDEVGEAIELSELSEEAEEEETEEEAVVGVEETEEYEESS
jgi:hypothetical protein